MLSQMTMVMMMEMTMMMLLLVLLMKKKKMIIMIVVVSNFCSFQAAASGVHAPLAHPDTFECRCCPWPECQGPVNVRH